MKYVILGAKGQLAREFIKVLSEKGDNYIALSREDLDITEIDKIWFVLREQKPNVVINCAAYNEVDKAETEFSEALSVNTFGPRNLALVCKDLKAFLIHFSTDYVFDGKKEDFYNEKDNPNPINKYGLSKFLGEKEIMSILDDKYLIFRVSWVYGEGKRNFLSKLIQWIETQEYLKIACDEFSVPTSTSTIVKVTLKALEEELIGLYHLVNSGYASRYEWAKEFLKLKGIKKFIYPVYRDEFNLPAKRPKWSVMSNEKICKLLKIDLKEWKDELQNFIKKV